MTAQVGTMIHGAVPIQGRHPADRGYPMPMKILTVALSLGAGFAAGVLLTAEPAAEIAAVETLDSTAHFDSTAPADERIRALEQAVVDERNVRSILEDQLHALMEEIERIDASGPRVIASEVAALQSSREQATLDSSRSSERRPGMLEFATSYRDARMNRLVQNGITPERAEWILRRESEARFEALQAEFDARRAGESIDPYASILDAQTRLRSDLGDADYENYLQSMGQPTAVMVQEVLASSPANRAGLQAGDQLVSYGGMRVFSMTELRAQAMQGQTGEDVVIEIMRDGTLMQLTMPRGPLGISGIGMRSPRLNQGGG
jgi:hypothetical protein